MFKLGESVSWKSQAGGSTKKKTGTVVGIVPAGPRKGLFKYIIPSLSFDEAHQKFNLSPIDCAGLSRNHESYLVSVQDGKTDKAKPKIYWPRVSSLQKAE